MKRKERWEWVWPTLLGCLGAGLLLYGKPVSAAVAQSLGLCTGVLLPTLFPFFVLSALLTHSCPFKERNRLTARLFGLPGAMAPALLLGAFGGYPVGARTVCQLYSQGRCTREQAEKALRFCNNAGPAFVLGAVGTGLLGDGRLGLRLWMIHLTSALLIGLFSSRKALSVKSDSITAISKKTKVGTAGFLQAVTDSMGAFLNVCAFVLIFAVLMCLLEQLPLLSRLPPPWDGLLYGFAELTGGIAKLAAASLPQRVLLPALSFLCGWGGLSVQCQTIDLLHRAGLPCRGYLKAKLLHGCVAAALTLLISG